MSERLDKVEKMIESLVISQAKTDEYIRENSRDIKALKESQAKTDEQLNRLEKSHGKLSKEIRNFIGNYGQTVEEYFFHSLEYSMKLGKIKFNSIRKNVKGMLTEHEYDIILANGDCIGVIEVKSKLHFEDVATLRKTHIDNFKKNFQEYKKLQILLCFSFYGNLSRFD